MTLTSPPVTPVSSPSPLHSQVVKGMRWAGGSQLAQQILNLGSSVIMARLLDPEDFGLLAMASVFTGVVTFVLDLGLSAAVVQRKDLSERQVSSIFWLNVGMGLLLMLVGLAVSGPIATFYRTPAVQPMVALMSSNFLIIALSRTQTAILNRQMDFRSLSLRTFFSNLVGIFGGIGLALLGWGVWSLIGRILATSVAETVFLWSVTGWRPLWLFNFPEVKPLLGFGNQVLAANVLRYIGRNADNLLIGRFVGATPLGYYALAYNLMMFPVQRFAQVMTQVLFPALSRLQEDPTRIRSGWLRAVKLMAAITVPLTIGVLILANPFVVTVYGAKWIPAAALLQVLSISGCLQSLGQIHQTLLLAQGKVRLRMRLTLLSVGLAVTAFLIGLPYGVIGVASCFALANTVAEVIFLWKTLQAVQSTVGEYLDHLKGVLAAGSGMALVLLLVLWIPLDPVPLLALGIGMGSLTYIGLLLGLDPALAQELRGMIAKRPPPQEAV